MTWALAILILLAAALAFNWWVGRPFPPAPLNEGELESELYGLCEYALVESCVRLTHCESNVVLIGNR